MLYNGKVIARGGAQGEFRCKHITYKCHHMTNEMNLDLRNYRFKRLYSYSLSSNLGSYQRYEIPQTRPNVSDRLYRRKVIDFISQSVFFWKPDVIYHKMSGIQRGQQAGTWETWRKTISWTHPSFFYGCGCVSSEKNTNLYFSSSHRNHLIFF